MFKQYLNKTKTVFLNLSNGLWFSDIFLENGYNTEKIKFSSSKFHKKHFSNPAKYTYENDVGFYFSYVYQKNISLVDATINRKYLTDGLRGVLTNLFVFELPYFSRRLEKNVLADEDFLRQYLESRIRFENISGYKIHSDNKKEIINHLVEDLRNFKQLKLDNVFRKFRKYIFQNKFKELNTYLEREIRIIVLTEEQVDDVLRKKKGEISTDDLMVYNIINFKKDDKIFK